MSDSLPLSLSLVNQILHPPTKKEGETEFAESEIVYLPLENFVTIVVNDDGELLTGHDYTQSNDLSQLQGQSETKREQE
jgi:hypothetical protein